MHKGVDWVSPDTPVTELAKLMREHDIGAIPIGENDQLIGMATDRDIVCKGLAQDGFDAGRATAHEVMTPGIHCCRDDDDLAKAARHMETLAGCDQQKQAHGRYPQSGGSQPFGTWRSGVRVGQERFSPPLTACRLPDRTTAQRFGGIELSLAITRKLA
jgi:CBS domain-containing protein